MKPYGIETLKTKVEVRLDWSLAQKIKTLSEERGYKPHHQTGEYPLSPVIRDILIAYFDPNE